MPESGPRYSHQSQGTVEQAVKALEGHVRTMLHRISDTLGVEFETTDPLVAWAVRHAAYLLTSFRTLESGRTPHRILRQKEDRGEIVEFGEQVWGRDPTPISDQSKLDVRWEKYLWFARWTSRAST